MKRFSITGLGLLALAMATPAAAADLPRGMPYKAPAFVSAYNWTGFYIGINGGGAWARSEWDSYGLRSDPSGGMVGLTAGYNWQGAGSPWVFGLEGDIDWAFIDGNTGCVVAISCETRNNFFGTFRGRVGYSFDRIMPYLTGGLAVGDIEVNRTFFPGTSDTNAGWTVGVGVEAAFAPNWSAKVEYLYADLGDIGCSAVQCGTPVNVDLTMNVLRAGVNYRF